MKFLSIMLYVVGICFCIYGFMGHYPAWSSAALCVFAATMRIVKSEKFSEKNSHFK